mmetsp:Transcript_6824/g.11306  ORF Transcript_6824/g.11306 Transcript_6824/m.11306 type:complete len:241 (-) Transcript_6824:319-1041(-)
MCTSTPFSVVGIYTCSKKELQSNNNQGSNCSVDKVDKFVCKKAVFPLRGGPEVALHVAGQERGGGNGAQVAPGHHADGRPVPRQQERAHDAGQRPLEADGALRPLGYGPQGGDQVGRLPVGLAHLAPKGIRELCCKRGKESSRTNICLSWKKLSSYGANCPGGSRPPNVLRAPTPPPLFRDAQFLFFSHFNLGNAGTKQKVDSRNRKPLPPKGPPKNSAQNASIYQAACCQRLLPQHGKN